LADPENRLRLLLYEERNERLVDVIVVSPRLVLQKQTSTSQLVEVFCGSWP
jgi:hypothetical protein